ncbi:hypothetical protein A4X13_0g8142 [Tilletia indica]|uniref:Uncharacterized protein n=1 Tax=Tilletia indica TaxID=43049 RepID=A0A8T8SG68_9BASI|nr:hypothetical protein A4X13_0g8142 [Tilletia indica]
MDFVTCRITQQLEVKAVPSIIFALSIKSLHQTTLGRLDFRFCWRASCVLCSNNFQGSDLRRERVSTNTLFTQGGRRGEETCASDFRVELREPIYYHEPR